MSPKSFTTCRLTQPPTVLWSSITVDTVSIVLSLDQPPEAIARPAGLLWSVFARSLGELGAQSRTALAWRWVLTGECPSPVTLSSPLGRLPGRAELLAEAEAPAELARRADPGGEVMQVRFVLQWLAEEIDALPLWNGGPQKLQVTDGAEYPHMWAEIDEVYSWALLAEYRYPWRAESDRTDERLAFGWTRGVFDLLTWVCGEASEGPLSGQRTAGRPMLYEVSLDVSRAMTGVIRAREAGDLVRARRRESLMETFLWLAGWNPLPPVDRHGHGAFEDCPESGAPCSCSDAGRCLRGDCAACWRIACVCGFGPEGMAALGSGAG